jgi:hypothetical protein
MIWRRLAYVAYPQFDQAVLARECLEELNSYSDGAHNFEIR